MKKIEIEIPDGKRAEWVNGVLTFVDDKPKDVTERIKTFEDALNEIGGAHPFVVEYFDTCGITGQNKCTPDLKAYLKLRIICAALNEGWKPKFTKDEWRYYPWFCLYTRKELEDMLEDYKKDLVIIDTDGYITEYAGLSFVYSNGAPSYTDVYLGSRFCFKNRDLAAYCGMQFISIWADYLLMRK